MAKIVPYYGYLIDLMTGDQLRLASAREAAAAKKSKSGIIVVDGHAVILKVNVDSVPKPTKYNSTTGFHKPADFTAQVQKAPRRKQVSGARKSAKRVAKAKKGGK